MRPLPALLSLLLLMGCRAATIGEVSKEVIDTGILRAVDADGDGFTVHDGDCDDDDASIRPDATEVCDGVDNDCDGRIDQGLLTTFFADTDADGFGDDERTIEACEMPEGYVTAGGDCDDLERLANPDAAEVCDEIDNDCDGGVDEEATDAFTSYADRDGDGFGDEAGAVTSCEIPTGYVDDLSDCDDTSPTINPGAAEVCDEIDNDCDGVIDTDATDPSSWYLDTDGDGYGVWSERVEGCEQPVGYVAAGGDCAPSDTTRHPGATEECNGVDDDCDGLTDEGVTPTWYLDRDEDGYGDEWISVETCFAPPGYVANNEDCDDGDPAITPELVWYLDGDADGFGDAAAPVSACERPTAYVSDHTDCDDADPTFHPGAAEECTSSEDRDCDGTINDGCTSCLEVLETGTSTGDGVYNIDPDGPHGPLSEADVWCDMTTDGGGWTMIQRTVWDWSESELLLTGFAEWYGATLGDPERGFAYRLQGAAWSEVYTSGEMLLEHRLRTVGGRACDPLRYKGTFSSLWVDDIEQAQINSFLNIGGVVMVDSDQLSTTDSGPSSSCPASYSAIPWFYAYCCSTCPTFLGGYWIDEPHPMAHYTSVYDLDGNNEVDVCGRAEIRMTDNGSSYRGIDSMGVYLR